MNLKPEIVHVLQREKAVCKAAITRLQAEIMPLEKEFGWVTEEFLQQFNNGQAGDEQEFFRWYALAEAINEWQDRLTYIRKLTITPNKEQ
jgi:hypothetical protein